MCPETTSWAKFKQLISAWTWPAAQVCQHGLLHVVNRQRRRVTSPANNCTGYALMSQTVASQMHCNERDENDHNSILHGAEHQSHSDEHSMTRIISVIYLLHCFADLWTPLLTAFTPSATPARQSAGFVSPRPLSTRHCSSTRALNHTSHRKGLHSRLAGEALLQGLSGGQSARGCMQHVQHCSSCAAGLCAHRAMLPDARTDAAQRGTALALASAHSMS